MSWVEDFYDAVINGTYQARYGMSPEQKQAMAESGRYGPYWSGSPDDRYMADRKAAAEAFGKNWGPTLGFAGTDMATNVANQIREGAQAIIPGGRGYSPQAVEAARSSAQQGAQSAMGQSEKNYAAGLNTKSYTNPSTADPNLPRFSEEVTVSAQAPPTASQQRSQADTSAFFGGFGAQNQRPSLGTGVGQPLLGGFGMYGGGPGGWGNTWGGGIGGGYDKPPWWVPD